MWPRPHLTFWNRNRARLSGERIFENPLGPAPEARDCANPEPLWMRAGDERGRGLTRAGAQIVRSSGLDLPFLFQLLQGFDPVRGFRVGHHPGGGGAFVGGGPGVEFFEHRDLCRQANAGFGH